jgi:uncharacterized protein YwbE
MTNEQDNNGDWFDRETGEVTEGEVTDIETSALVPMEAQTITVDAPPRMFAPNELPDLDGMQESFKLEAKYFEFEEKGQSKRGVYLGMTKMQSQDNGKIVDMAQFQNKDGVWVNSGAALTRQLRERAVPIGTPLQVMYLGKKDTKTGHKIKNYEVRVLNEKPAPVIPDVPAGIPSMKSKQAA